jgi:hypothetical protein
LSLRSLPGALPPSSTVPSHHTRSARLIVPESKIVITVTHVGTVQERCRFIDCLVNGVRMLEPGAAQSPWRNFATHCRAPASMKSTSEAVSKKRTPFSNHGCAAL